MAEGPRSSVVVVEASHHSRPTAVFHHDTHHLEPTNPQRFGGPDETAPNADVHARSVDAIGKLIENLLADGSISAEHVAVVELVGGKSAFGVDNLTSPLARSWNQTGMDATRAVK